MLQPIRYFLFLAFLACTSAFAQVPGIPLNLAATTAKSGDPQSIAIGELPRRIVEESAYAERAVQKSAGISVTDADDQELESIARDLDALGKKLR